MDRQQTLGLGFLAIAWCASCGWVAQRPAQTPFMKAVPGVEMTSNELRARMLELGRSFTRDIGEAALYIRETSKDPVVRRNAMLWAVNGVPVAHEAVLNLDPLVALADTWALALQTRDFFTTGPGKNAFGDQQRVALDAIQHLQNQIDEVVNLVFEDDELLEPRAFLNQWAADNPIDSLLFFRASASTSFPKAFSKTRRGLGGVIGDTEDKFTVLSQRLALANEFLLRQVRWTGELAIQETLGTHDASAILPTILAATGAATQLLQELPKLIAHERRAVLQGIADERRIIMSDIDRQRVETLSMFDKERLGFSAFLREERVAVTGDVRHMLESGPHEARALIDHVFWRAFQLLLVLGALMIVGALLTVWLFRRER